MNIKEFRKLCVGDVIYIPELEPGPSHLTVVQGFEHMKNDGQDNPFVQTVSFRYIFPQDVESVVSWKEGNGEIDPPWSNQVTVGDPLFESEDKHEIS